MDDAAVEAADEAPSKQRIGLPLLLFLATIVTTFHAGNAFVEHGTHPLRGWVFAVPFLGILTTHELGHWVLARRHRIATSLPHFIPFPLGFGTFGAVIGMRGRIRTRDALFDVGASGPLAGLLVAIPVLVVGLKLSRVLPSSPGGIDEGQSLLYLAIKWLVFGKFPPGHDVYLHPTAFAGWAGLYMTMLNLLPIGQLDGGHVAYALFGERQDRIARLVHRALLPLAVLVPAYLVFRARQAHVPWGEALSQDLPGGINWIIWWLLLRAMTRRGNHPPVEPGSVLSPRRRVLAMGTLVLFVLLFVPIAQSIHR